MQVTLSYIIATPELVVLPLFMLMSSIYGACTNNSVLLKVILIRL